MPSKKRPLHLRPDRQRSPACTSFRDLTALVAEIGENTPSWEAITEICYEVLEHQQDWQKQRGILIPTVDCVWTWTMGHSTYSLIYGTLNPKP